MWLFYCKTSLDFQEGTACLPLSGHLSTLPKKNQHTFLPIQNSMNVCRLCCWGGERSSTDLKFDIAQIEAGRWQRTAPVLLSISKQRACSVRQRPAVRDTPSFASSWLQHAVSQVFGWSWIAAGIFMTECLALEYSNTWSLLQRRKLFLALLELSYAIF